MNIIVYTKTNCPNCVSAKQLLKAKGLEFNEVDFEQLSETGRQAFLDAGLRQMPQIFINDERIGGFAGLREWIKWKEEQK